MEVVRGRFFPTVSQMGRMCYHRLAVILFLNTNYLSYWTDILRLQPHLDPQRNVCGSSVPLAAMPMSADFGVEQTERLRNIQYVLRHHRFPFTIPEQYAIEPLLICDICAVALLFLLFVLFVFFSVDVRLLCFCFFFAEF